MKFLQNIDAKVGHKWENAMTVDRRSWGNRKNLNIEDILSPEVNSYSSLKPSAHPGEERLFIK
jgi:hypothetical protein